jgi:hypothetical protein
MQATKDGAEETVLVVSFISSFWNGNGIKFLKFGLLSIMTYLLYS